MSYEGTVPCAICFAQEALASAPFCASCFDSVWNELIHPEGIET